MKSAQKELGLPENSLVTDCQTHRGSTQKMINRVMEQEKATVQLTGNVAGTCTTRHEKLARVQGYFKELRTKPKSLESSTIANLPERLLLRVLAQS